MTTTIAETQPLNLRLNTVSIHNSELTVQVVNDNHPDMQLAYRLWYEVYVEELGYQVSKGVNHAERLLHVAPNNSYVFMAIENGKCVATLRTTHDSVSPLEFSYNQWLPEARFAEISKLIMQRRFRSSTLTAHLMVNTFKFHEQITDERPYDYLACHTKLKLFPYYRLFGWQKLSDTVFTHPVLNYECVLCKCSKERFIKACNELEMIANGNHFIKAKWAIKYLMNKWI